MHSVPEIEVDPPTLQAMAARLRAACGDAAEARAAARDADAAVTGDGRLSAALRHHSTAWAHSLDRIRAHVDEVAAALDAAADGYAATEGTIASAAG